MKIIARTHRRDTTAEAQGGNRLFPKVSNDFQHKPTKVHPTLIRKLTPKSRTRTMGSTQQTHRLCTNLRELFGSQPSIHSHRTVCFIKSSPPAENAPRSRNHMASERVRQSSQTTTFFEATVPLDENPLPFYSLEGRVLSLRGGIQRRFILWEDAFCA
ncbi:hypothetical protein L1049_002511 [Liquidambar formosana]|uniref:Uncharacterized protein n=1 Tax=Liquidambar formosana TaxID=63359 RepID=A0AAP0NFV4_LIQFO